MLLRVSNASNLRRVNTLYAPQNYVLYYYNGIFETFPDPPPPFLGCLTVLKEYLLSVAYS
ncbi:hypothetical protein A3206_00445 [Candidatus Methanomassiliicoccus intestinalis]|jgi:hypothetical protein|nr:MAG: hypothetical protein A3206_00445 [Candidatus Methanomassiliicoccus intestinalis]